jgi:hypothetical protein
MLAHITACTFVRSPILEARPMRPRPA